MPIKKQLEHIMRNWHGLHAALRPEDACTWRQPGSTPGVEREEHRPHVAVDPVPWKTLYQCAF